MTSTGALTQPVQAAGARHGRELGGASRTVARKDRGGRSTSELTPRSPATCAIGRPLSSANRTPRSNSSCGYFRGLAMTRRISSPQDSILAQRTPRNPVRLSCSCRASVAAPCCGGDGCGKRVPMPIRAPSSGGSGSAQSERPKCRSAKSRADDACVGKSGVDSATERFILGVRLPAESRRHAVSEVEHSSHFSDVHDVLIRPPDLAKGGDVMFCHLHRM